MSDNNDKHGNKTDWWQEVDRSADLDHLPGFKETVDTLKSFDPVSDRMMSEDDDFFARLDERLHDKIMAGVEKTVMQEKKAFWHRYRRIAKRHAKGVAAAIALISVTLMGHFTEPTIAPLDSTDLVINDVVNQSEDMDQTIVVYQSKDDFFVDVARESLNHLSVDQMQGLVSAARD